MKFQLEGTIESEKEDSGMARIAQIGGDSDSPFFIRLQSWAEDKQHELMDALEGRRVRVTVETIEKGDCMPLELINNDPVILASNKSGSHKTGSLSRLLSVDDITKALGFGPNIDDDPDKVEYSWGFTADGVQCGIWDYKGSRWSTFGPSWVFDNLFPGKVGI